MRPYFFGPPERQLFAVHHPAQIAGRRHGAVICYPWGHEYVNSLRGCRQLAARLARLGMDVLRFDYYGTGDSAGQGEDASLSTCVEDVVRATEELVSSCGVRTVSMIGVRWGGCVASLAATLRVELENLVLWEPVVAGRTYLGESRARHAAFLASERQAAYSGPHEIMGFPLPPTLVAQLEATDLSSIGRSPAPHVLLLGDEQDETGRAQRAFGARLAALCDDFDHRRLPGQGIWIREVGQERALVPTSILDAILEWFTSRLAAGDQSAPHAASNRT